MDNDIILLDDVMQLMHKTDKFGMLIPVDITAVTQDLGRKTGGERIRFPKAVLCNPEKAGKKNFIYGNNTINVKNFGTKEVRSIHPLLITHCNGKKVAL